MDIYREIELSSKKGKTYIIDQLIDFCVNSESWKQSIQSTKNYQNMLDGKIGLIIEKEGECELSFLEKSENKLLLVNIVPLNTGQLSEQSYNDIALVFCDDFKTWKNQNDVNILLKKSKKDLELKDIISAEIPRKDFEVYLSHNPLSWHPLDIDRLNQFIITACIFPRKDINWNYLAKYLKSKHQWPDDSIQKCISRINNGICLLRKYRENDRNFVSV